MLHLGTFCVDVTPPVGFPTGFGTGEPTEAIRDPLFLRGFIFDDGECRCLVASLDYCGLMNSAYDELCAALAQAVETTPERIGIGIACYETTVRLSQNNRRLIAKSCGST